MNVLKHKPLVSILICSFNAGKFIESTLRSVLGQTYANFEVLVLDNNSQDNTVGIVEKLADKDKRLKLVKSGVNLGAYPGLNYLLERAKGAYIAINDHDDIWHKEKLEKQVAILEKNKEYIGCGTGILNWYEKYKTFIYRTQPSLAMVAWHTTLVFRKGPYRYNPDTPLATDFLFMRNSLCTSGKKIYNLKAPLVIRRIFEDGSNLSGRWMQSKPIVDIARLKIGLVDRLALINRVILPRKFAEWVLVKTLGGKYPAFCKPYISNAMMLLARL